METKRLFFLSVGSTLLGIGVIGIIIPVLPTRPFILTSAFFMVKVPKD